MKEARGPASVVLIFTGLGAVSALFVVAAGAMMPLSYLLFPGLFFAVAMLIAVDVVTNLGRCDLHVNTRQKFWFTTVLAISYLPTPWIERIAAGTFKIQYGSEVGLHESFLSFLFPGIYAFFCVAIAILVLVRRFSPFGLTSLFLVGITAGPISMALLNLIGTELLPLALFLVCHTLSGAAVGIWLMDPHWHVLPERS